MNTRGWMALVAKIALLSFVLLIVQGIGAQFLPATPAAAGATDGASPGQQTSQSSASFLALVLLICLLQTVALVYPIARSRWHGWLLTGTVFALYFGTVTFMSQIESLVYLKGKMPAGLQAGIIVMGFFNALVFAPILVLTLRRWRPQPADVRTASSRLRMSWQGWAWRTATAAVVMLALYYLFGYFVAWKNPVVRDYYGGSDPGTFFAQLATIVRDAPWMIPLQLARALLWVVLALPVIRMMRGRWWEAGLAVSLLFAVPSLYLLLPNPMMPGGVRMVHLIETLPYQFLFGWFVAWLFTWQPGPGRTSAKAALPLTRGVG